MTIAGYVHGIGGMQRHTIDLARGLSAAGHDVEVITKRHPEGLRQERHEGVLWHFAPADGKNVDEAWHRASHDVFVRLHRERPFDIIHSESTGALGLVRKGIHRELPIAVKYHGNYVGLAKAHLRRVRRHPAPLEVAREIRGFLWLSRRHFRRGNWWRFYEFESMVPSRQQLSDQRLSHCVPRSRLHVVPNAVDVERFRPRDRTRMREELGLGEVPLLVAVGRLNREKGMHTAIAALARLEPPVRLAIVGTGEERAKLEELATTRGVADRVDFVGAKPVEDVARFLAAADAFVFPTERDEAGPGLTLLEAMAAGVPIVASRIPQIEEAVDRPGEDGVLVEPGDAKAMAAALAELLRDPARAARIGSAGRERVLEDYTLERMIERAVAVYELAMRKHRPRSRRRNAFVPGAARGGDAGITGS